MAPTPYPKRPKFFANKFIRVMHKTCLAQSLGVDAVLLLTFIVIQEDAVHYKRSVTFYNDQLLPICGFGKWKRLDNARSAAVKAGWLNYESGGSGHRKPGTYFVMIPDDYKHVSDAPISENFDPETDMDNIPERDTEHVPDRDTLGDNEGEKHIPNRDMVRDMPRDTLRYTVRDTLRDNNHTYSLSPFPIPIPNTNTCPSATDGSLFPEAGSDQPGGKRETDNGDQIREVFAHYRTHHPRSFREPQSTSEEWKRIRARLREGFTVEDLKQAIDGCHVCPHNCGQNSQNQKYQDLKLIVKDGGQVTRFMEEWENRGRPVLSEKNLKNQRAADQFLEMQGVKRAN